MICGDLMTFEEIKSLVKLANDLDAKGLYSEADAIDEVILKVSQSNVNMADDEHNKQIALMKFLSKVAGSYGVGENVYVVGGAVRDYFLGKPIKDVDVVIDIVATGDGKNSEWFAKKIQREIPAATDLTVNNYGVAILTIKGQFNFDGQDLKGQVIEIANTRQESYGGDDGKGYKPSEVLPADIKKDVERREFNFNTLLWKLESLSEGPEKAEIIDITGCGLRDLSDGTISCPRDPNIVFADDPTRMIRLIKFVGRYNFRVPPDVREAVISNADKIALVPQNAISTILIRDIFNKPYARKVLDLMVELGLMDSVVKLAESDSEFKNTLQNATKSFDKFLLADLIYRGYGELFAPKLLRGEIGQRYSQVILGMSEEEAEYFISVFNRPPIDNPQYIKKFKLKGPSSSMPMSLARELLVSDPSLASNPEELNNQVEIAMRLRLL